jgi:hypothetical protein
VTQNISMSGCFLICFKELSVGDLLELKFVELQGLPPVKAEVRWTAPWGKHLGIPGAGCVFRDLSGWQLRHLRGVLERDQGWGVLKGLELFGLKKMA